MCVNIEPKSRSRYHSSWAGIMILRGAVLLLAALAEGKTHILTGRMMMVTVLLLLLLMSTQGDSGE